MAQCAGLISQASCYAAHAILARRGEWITNEKQLLTKADLRSVDATLIGLSSEPDDLALTLAQARGLLTLAVGAEGILT